jgi:AcrR family transcriptional regulator
MPTPARTSLQEIVAAGRALVEADGVQALTMQRVAAAVGVRAPSLYKRVTDRTTLVRLIVEDVLRELTERLDRAATTGDPRRDLAALALAFRSFAHERPRAYALLFAGGEDADGSESELLARASAAVLRTAEALTGPEHALEAARTVTAWAHGFVSMELAGAFRLGGDVDAAFAYGVDRLTNALATGSSSGG